MIPKDTIRALVKKRFADARILFRNDRYSAAMYLCGYSLELGLKHGICTIMKFDNGFPENKQEFNTYYLDTTKTFLRSTIRELRDIRHHRLQDLLRYSGEQVNIEKNFAEAWNVAINWTPEMRYKNDVIRRKRVERFIQSVRVILNEIM